jgi:Ferritin-like domain
MDRAHAERELSEMDGRPTRRALIRGGIIAGGGALASAGAAALLDSGAAQAAASRPAEERALTHALELEQLMVIAYRRVLGSRVIRPDTRPQLTTMLDQELQHLNLLEHVLRQRGETVPKPPSLSDAQAALSRHDVHWSLTALTNQHQCLKLLVDVESLVENGYFKALGAVEDATLLRACAEIMGCEAQHWTVLSGLLNHQDAMRAVPYPFVEGTP